MPNSTASNEQSLMAAVFGGVVDSAAHRQSSRSDSSAGRPRDPGIEERALHTALRVYASLGWSGFTIGKVATQAHMGKSSLYLRWSSKETMLLDAFYATDAFLQRRESELSAMPFVDRLLQVVQSRVETYFTDVGLAVIRLNLENQTSPEAVGEVWEKSVGRAVLRTRKMIQAGIDDGILKASTNLVQLGDSLEGAMIMHVLATPPKLRERAAAGLATYADELVARTAGPWLTDSALQSLGAYGSDRARALLPRIRAVHDECGRAEA
ncbi:MAG: helix-turn-helix domain-containing protein [Actinomycetaceae bacterium]|nr:helix-turn-helix domain-containing protein [Actinomycetaceae bacterium]